jgi:nucleotide-binding universal stress UspA family protein
MNRLPTGEVEARAYLGSLAGKLRSAGIAVQSRTFDGPAVEYILSLASQTPHSLVVLTTHGRSARARWFVGSGGEGVVQAASVPVLVIPVNTVGSIRPSLCLIGPGPVVRSTQPGRSRASR